VLTSTYSGRAFVFMWHYPLDSNLLCTGTTVALQTFDGHTQGHPVCHRHKEVALSGCLAQWAYLAMRLPVQQPAKLSPLAVCHQGNLWVVIFVPFILPNLVMSRLVHQHTG
jgi:hypothetical protein